MVHIRPMTPADLPLGMRLKQQAGWNQLEEDWQRFLDLEPDGCFVGSWDGVEVGTVTTCLFHEVGWIAMMLVDQAHRGKGIGRALMNHALDYLERRGAVTVRLDATALGRPLYEKLGFKDEYLLARYAGLLPPGPEVLDVRPVRAPDWEDLIALDRSGTGTDRGRLLRRLHDARPEEMRVFMVEGSVAGYVTVRPGAQAVQIGPCIATPSSGRFLFADVVYRHGGQHVYIDIPDGNNTAMELARGWGLTVQRELVRMCRGRKVPGLIETLWASSGPEMG